MKAIAWLMLVAAVLPFAATIIAKAGGAGFDNNNPRPWLARQEGWRARANAAQSNLFEALPFFYGAVLFALFNHADVNSVAALMLAWVVLRFIYVGVYIGGRGAVRSVIWAVCLILNISILFT
ncbi:MAG TPA: MAPEG family protein [Burkholderiaceae bacterium]|nr:MAPEG family protein [Burkholderiaceae bacterium]